MSPEKILKEAKKNEKEMKKARRYLHRNAETGFNLEKTLKFVKGELKKLGCDPVDCGRSGVIATIGCPESSSCILLRADMDALPINEETALPFASKNGNMHACGHDMHTAMLLGAAKILKKHEKELKIRVKLMFQPAEEILEGAKDMINSGVLDRPEVEAALMLHVATALDLESGSVVLPAPGISAPSADHFKIEVTGRACHGSTPSLGVDAINAAAHILLGLSEISAREISAADHAVLTVGKFNGGSAANAIAGNAVMKGTLRCYDEDLRSRIKERMAEITESTALAYRAKAELAFEHTCPSFINDEKVLGLLHRSTVELLGEQKVYTAADFPNRSAGGSEDFSYVSQRVPTTLLSLAAGKRKDGYAYPLHHPKADFDESVLPIGAAILSFFVLTFEK